MPKIVQKTALLWVENWRKYTASVYLCEGGCLSLYCIKARQQENFEKYRIRYAVLESPDFHAFCFYRSMLIWVNYPGLKEIFIDVAD